MAVTKTQVWARLKSAKSAAESLEEDVRWLVSNRAWTVMGYANFSEMWEKENALEPSIFLKALATSVLVQEGVNTRNGKLYKNMGPNGHMPVDVANMIGFGCYIDELGVERSSTASEVIKQITDGVAIEEVRSRKPKSRQQSRRLGKTPDEFVDEGFKITRRDADAMNEIARKANVPKAELYRQAVAEYLARHTMTRPRNVSSKA